MTTPVSRNSPGIASSQPTARQSQVPTQTEQPAAAPQRLELHARDTFETGNAGLDAINATRLTRGAPHTCVTTTRDNLRRAGLSGIPSSTSADGNNPRGMMVQMLQSNQWRSMPIPGATSQTITSPYGSVQAQVLTGEAYLQAARNGQIPEGSVVFQTRTGWDYGERSRGSDVGIVRNGGIFNYQQFNNMSVYGNDVRQVVVLQPNGR